MKRIHCIVSLIIATLFIGTVLAQQDTVRVGVVPFKEEGKKQASGMMAATMADALHSYKFIKLVEQENLAELLEEVAKGQSGIYDESTAVQAGKLNGIQIMVMGTVSGNTVAARAVLVETGAYIATAVGTKADAKDMAKKLAAGIEQYIARENLKKMKNDSPDIDFTFWAERPGGAKITDKAAGSLAIGSKVVFRFKANTDGYCTIVDLQPNGDVVVLFPNDSQPDNKVQANKLYSIPSEEDGFDITVDEPAGLDTVVAFFTKKKVDWLDRSKLTGEGFQTVKEGEKSEMSRGFTVKATKLKAAEWETRVLNVEVK